MSLESEIQRGVELVKNLQTGFEVHLNWSEESGGLVTKSGDLYTLEEIPQFGGVSISSDEYREDQIEEVVRTAYEWN